MTRTATKQTIAHALAYVAITDSIRRLHHTTYVAINDYWTLDAEAFRTEGGHLHVMTPEGMDIAIRSPLWKGHQHLLELGCEPLRDDARASPNRVRYVFKDDRRRRAFVYRDGTVYADPPGDPVNLKEIAKFGYGA